MNLPLACATLTCRQSSNIAYHNLSDRCIKDKRVLQSMVEYLRSRTNDRDTEWIDEMFPGCDDATKKYIVNTVMIMFGFYIHVHNQESDKFRRMSKVYSHVHILCTVSKRLISDSVFLSSVRRFMARCLVLTRQDFINPEDKMEIQLDYILEYCMDRFDRFMSLSRRGSTCLECCIFCDITKIEHKDDWLSLREQVNCYCCNQTPISSFFHFIEKSHQGSTTWAQEMLAKIMVVIYLSNQHCYSILRLCRNWATFEGWHKSMTWSPAMCQLMRPSVVSLLQREIGFTAEDAGHIFDYSVEQVVHVYDMNSFILDGRVFCMFCTEHFKCPICE